MWDVSHPGLGSLPCGVPPGKQPARVSPYLCHPSGHPCLHAALPFAAIVGQLARPVPPADGISLLTPAASLFDVSHQVWSVPSTRGRKRGRCHVGCVRSWPEGRRPSVSISPQPPFPSQRFLHKCFCSSFPGSAFLLPPPREAEGLSRPCSAQLFEPSPTSMPASPIKKPDCSLVPLLKGR